MVVRGVVEDDEVFAGVGQGAVSGWPCCQGVERGREGDFRESTGWGLQWIWGIGSLDGGYVAGSLVMVGVLD